MADPQPVEETNETSSQHPDVLVVLKVRRESAPKVLNLLCSRRKGREGRESARAQRLSFLDESERTRARELTHQR